MSELLVAFLCGFLLPGQAAGADEPAFRHVYVPMDCTAHNDEKQVLQAFSLFTSFGYKHNVTMTRSDLIQLY